MPWFAAENHERGKEECDCQEPHESVADSAPVFFMSGITKFHVLSFFRNLAEANCESLRPSARNKTARALGEARRIARLRAWTCLKCWGELWIQRSLAFSNRSHISGINASVSSFRGMRASKLFVKFLGR